MGEINKILRNNFHLNSSEIIIINFLAEKQGKKFTADEICENLELPKGKIYDILNSLERRNFINVEYKTPKLYSIENFKKCFEAAFETEEKFLMETERKVMAELRPLEKKELEIKIITDDDELYFLRQKELIKCKEYRKASFNPYIIIEDESTRRKYRQNVLTTVIENNIAFKWIIAADKANELKIPRIASFLKDVLKYNNIDIRLSNVIPSFDVCGGTVLIRTTHMAGGKYIFIKSKQFAEDCAKLYDNIFDHASPIKKILK